MKRRPLAVAVLAAVSTAAGLALGARRLGDPRAAIDAAAAVTWLAGAALLGCLLWLGLAVVATAIEAGRCTRCATDPIRVPVPLPALPVPLRRLVLLACGVAVVGGLAVPAQAAPEPARRPSTAAALDGLPLPHLPAGGPIPRPAPAPEPDPAGVHLVAPGESLWSITADLLGPDADDAAVAAAWPLLRRANRAELAADPDLLRPGQLLRVPGPLRRPAGPTSTADHRRPLTERPSR